jgi:hypothetical protein
MRVARALCLCLALILAQSARAAPVAPVLDLCIAEYASHQATYNAHVSWPTPKAAPHLVIGAGDSSGVVWVQKAYGKVTGSGEDYVSFTVSDVSAYPLDIAVYALSDEAWRGYQKGCARKACYFAPDDPGVEMLTSALTVQSADDMMKRHLCPRKSA